MTNLAITCNVISDVIRYCIVYKHGFSVTKIRF